MAGAIAVAVDGTEACRAALQFAIGMAREKSCGLAGVFVIDSGWADFIGNDWQSSRNARQGFLDYVLQEQERQAEQARLQFEAATGGLEEISFTVLVGKPSAALVDLMARGKAGVLVIGRGVFEVCGRPSIKYLPKEVIGQVRQPVFLV